MSATRLPIIRGAPRKARKERGKKYYTSTIGQRLLRNAWNAEHALPSSIEELCCTTRRILPTEDCMQFLCSKKRACELLIVNMSPRCYFFPSLVGSPCIHWQLSQPRQFQEAVTLCLDFSKAPRDGTAFEESFARSADVVTMPQVYHRHPVASPSYRPSITF